MTVHASTFSVNIPIQYTTSILLVLLTINNDISSAKICNGSSENWQSRIGILISPIISGSMMREIEIYWNNVNIEPEDKISLYVEDSKGLPREIYTVVPNDSNGIQKTGVLAEFVPSANLSFVSKCIKYGIIWKSNRGDVKRIDCLRTYPTWMKDMKDILGPLRIKDIFLPGTHDSAAYDVNGTMISIISKFAVTQDLDILGQLIHGVRYLDIRLGHYPENSEVWWTIHGPFYRSVPLKTVIDHVKSFLDNTKEIVIMDIREFAVGFNNYSDHRALVSHLEHEFRDYYLTRNNQGWGVTLNEIWSSGKRLIIGYEDSKVVANHASVWPCVTHKWGNVKTVEDLYKYLHKVETNNR
ncbi:PI-PLC X domain-containing protein 1-like [Apis florea]|uniref:PI-PLC X domain-containing protein 1-like n=1 Tax=Apis florea TaxID=7463 RepID=UPI000629A6BD|nr:PI-PLC X domain-containing protein 1-like [Apis florea]